jgi:hypothetical protein
MLTRTSNRIYGAFEAMALEVQAHWAAKRERWIMVLIVLALVTWIGLAWWMGARRW